MLRKGDDLGSQARQADRTALKDGHTIATLGDARAVMQSLSERRERSELWLYVGALMLEAAVQRLETTEAAAQLNRALKAEGLI